MATNNDDFFDLEYDEDDDSDVEDFYDNVDSESVDDDDNECVVVDSGVVEPRSNMETTTM